MNTVMASYDTREQARERLDFETAITTYQAALKCRFF
jgi:hypothetical protein